MNSRKFLAALVVVLAIGTSVAYLLRTQVDPAGPSDGLSPAPREAHADVSTSDAGSRAASENTRSAAPSGTSGLPESAAGANVVPPSSIGPMLLYGRIEVLATGPVEAPRIEGLAFVDARGTRREARLHSEARYTCSELAPGSAHLSVHFASGAIADLDVEIPAGPDERRLDLRVPAPYHVAIPVFLLTPDGQRFRSAAHAPEQPWHPLVGIEWLGLWVAVAADELPDRLARSGAGPDSREIGRWTYHDHLRVPKDADGTLELLRWAPTTHVALYRDDHRLASAQFQHPPERLELVVDPAPFLRERPATIRVRCVEAQDLAPLTNTLLTIDVDGEPGQRMRPLQDGHLSIVNLRPGRRSLTLRPNRRVARRIELELESGEERNLGELLFERGRTLHLRVRDDTDVAWRGVALIVQADEAERSRARGVALDSEGYAEIAGLEPARHLVWLAESAGAPIAVRALVDLADEESEELHLRWPTTRHPLTVSARLEPWERGLVELSSASGVVIERIRVAGAREIGLELPAGTHHLRLVDPEGAEVAALAVELPRSATTPVRLARHAR
jgi:hypothetical protein